MKKLICLLAIIVGCAETPTIPDPVAPPEQPVIPDTQPPVEESIVVKLSWPRSEWNDILIGEVTKNFDNLNLATDTTNFCPKFKSLSKEKKVIAFAEILIGIMKYESGWDPTSRMKESGLGIDRVTGMQVWSEGLLQLSYGDKEWAPWCEFDWKKDKLLPIAARTITNPRINLACGIRILANQVKSKRVLTPVSGYWSVLNTGSKYRKISEIQGRVKNLELCK